MVVERHRLHSVAVLKKFLIQRLERASLKSVQVNVGVRGLKETFIFLRSHVGPARNRCQVPVYVVNNGAIVLFGDVLDIREEVLRPLDVSNLDLRLLLPLVLELFKIHFFCCHDHGMGLGRGRGADPNSLPMMSFSIHGFILYPSSSFWSNLLRILYFFAP